MYKNYIENERACGKKHVLVHENGRDTPAQNNKKIKKVKKQRVMKQVFNPSQLTQPVRKKDSLVRTKICGSTICTFGGN